MDENVLGIASLVVDVLTAMVIPLAVWLLTRHSNRIAAEAKAAVEETERKREEADRERERKREEADRERELKRERYDELNEAFNIHAALTASEVLSMLPKVKENEQARDYLIALHARSSYRFAAFSSEFDLPEDVEKMVRAQLTTINEALPEETEAAQVVFDDKAQRTQNHQKSATVQARISEFAFGLTGQWLERDKQTQVRPEYADIFSTVRVSRGGQAVRLTVNDDSQRFWFAGNGKGVLPAIMGHEVSKGCVLSSSAAGSLKTRLANLQGNGELILEELARDIRKRAETSPTCTCGTPFLVQRSRTEG